MSIDAEILRRLQANDPSLTDLDLKVDDAFSTRSDLIQLCHALSTNTELRSLSLSCRKNISDTDVQLLACLNLISLTIFGSVISDVGAHALAQNRTLKDLTIYEGQISDNAAIALANSSLSKLALPRSRLGDIGAAALAHNRTIKILDLSYNQIGDKGASALAGNSVLITLNISSNQIGDLGAEALARNRSLKSLTLTKNDKITDKGAKAFINNTSLTFCYVIMHSPIESEIKAMLQRNQQATNDLIAACRANDLHKASVLLKQNVYPFGDYIGLQLRSADHLLHMAVRHRNENLIHLLLSYGCEAGELNKDGLTYIQLAQQLGFRISTSLATTNKNSLPIFPHDKLKYLGPAPVVSQVLYLAKALEEYRAQDAYQLTLKKGDILQVLNVDPYQWMTKGWFYCQKTENGAQGYVFKDYLAKLLQTEVEPTIATVAPAALSSAPVSTPGLTELHSTPLAMPASTSIAPISLPPASSSSSSSTGSASTQLSLLDSFLVAYSKLKLAGRLGEGAYGVVFKATLGYESVAVKQLNIEVANESAITSFLSEANHMKQLHSNYTVRLLGICNEPYCLILEFMAGGSLYGYLQKNQPSTVMWLQRIQIALDISYGLAYLHSKHIIHRDLKSLNVLLDDRGRAKLSDFGLTTTKAASSSAAKTKSACGTTAWMAPELLDPDADEYEYNTQTDMFAYAMVLWELASHQTPFQGLKEGQIPGKILAGKRPDIPTFTPNAYGRLVASCWEQIATARSDIDTAINALSNLEQLEKAKGQAPEYASMFTK